MNLFFEFFKRFLFQARAGSFIRRMSWLTVTGMTFTVTLLVLVISVMNALNDNVRERTLAIDPHLVVYSLDKEVKSFLQESNLRFSQVEYRDVILRTQDGRVKGASGRGLDSQGLNQVRLDLERLKLAYQQNSMEDNLKVDAQEMWIGSDLADQMGVLPGDELQVMSPEELLGSTQDILQWDRVKVRGLLRTNITEIDSAGFFYDREKSFRKLKPTVGIRRGFEVWLPDASLASSWKRKLQKKFNNLEVQTWQERHSAIFFALKLEKMMITLFLSFAVLIASLSFLAVMSMLVSQRQKEMGILQALGLSRMQTRKLFFCIGLSLAALGLTFGLVLGCGISYWIELHPIQGVLPSIYFDTRIPARLDFRFTWVVALIGFGLSSLGAWWISRGVLSKSVSELVRHR